MTLFRRISPTAILALSVGAIALAALSVAMGYVGDQMHQRTLQNEFERLPGCEINGSMSEGTDSWLEHLWPDDQEDMLPHDGIGIQFGSDATPEGLAHAQRLRNIFSASLNGCPLEDFWPWIVTHKDLEDLRLEDVAITDDHIAQLVGHSQVYIIAIRNAPVTDASLTTLGNLPLVRLELRNTQITLAKIDAFATAHPSVRITWTPQLTAEQLRIKTTLAERHISVGPRFPNEGIAREFGWSVSFGLDAKPTPEDFSLLAMLPGPIVYYVEIWEPLDDEALAKIRDLPGILHVRWFRREKVYESILFLSEAPAIKQFDFSFDAVTPEQMETLRSKHAGKLVNWSL